MPDLERKGEQTPGGTRMIRWEFVGVGILVLGIAAFAVFVVVSAKTGVWDPAVLVVAVFGALVTATAARSSWSEGRALDAATSSAQTTATKDLLAVAGPDDILGLIKYNRSQMEAYDTAARAQAERSHLAALWAMGFGFLFLVGGLVVAIQVPDGTSKFTFAGVAALGAAASSYIARTFLVNARAATQTAMYYFQNPLVSSYLLTAERVTATLPPSARAEHRAAIITAAISQADSAARTASPKDVLK